MNARLLAVLSLSTIGVGGRQLELETVNGGILLRR